MIERKPLRAEVEKEILARIADHRLAAGARIRENRLSAELDVSRTPLREAMLGLEARGVLDSEMGRGFRVPPISADRFGQMQAMLARMAPYALDLGGSLPGPRVMELSNLLSRARLRLDSPGPERADTLADLVHRWSTLCVSGCPNGVLVADIERLEELSRRYWREAVIRYFVSLPMIDSYDEIYELLRTQRKADAVVAWENHIVHFAGEAVRHLAAESLET